MLKPNYDLWTSYNTARTAQSVIWVPLILFAAYMEIAFAIYGLFCMSLIWFGIGVAAIIIYIKSLNKINKFYEPYFKKAKREKGGKK